MSDPRELSIRSLSPAQRALLDKRLRDAVAGTVQTEQIPRSENLPEAALSYGEDWFWYCLDRWSHSEPGPVYIIPAALKVEGPLSFFGLDQAVHEVMRRHAILRAAYPLLASVRRRLIRPSIDIDLRLVDLTGLPIEAAETVATTQSRNEARRPFDLSKGHLMRAALLELQHQRVLVVTKHHIVSDGWSMAIFTKEVAALYEVFVRGAPSLLPELTLQYADYAKWQKDRLQGEVLNNLLAYWEQRIKGAPLKLELPTDRPRPPIQTTRGGKESVFFGPQTVAKVMQLCLDERVTLFMVLLAAFNILLTKVTSQLDIVVGSPVAGRIRPWQEGLIGYFANNIVFRTDLSDDPSFRDLLTRERDVVLSAFAHQELPFLLLVKALHPEQDLKRPPVIQVLFVLENTPPLTLRFGNILLTSLPISTGVATREISAVAMEEKEGVTITIVYNADLFDPETIRAMLTRYQVILQKAVENPMERVSLL